MNRFLKGSFHSKHKVDFVIFNQLTLENLMHSKYQIIYIATFQSY